MPRERPYPNRYPDLRMELRGYEQAQRRQALERMVFQYPPRRPQSRGGGAGYPGY